MSEMRTFWTTPATTIDMSALTNEIAALRSQLAAADHELKIAKICNDSQAEHINTLTLAKQTAERERDEARRERDALELFLGKRAESYRLSVLAAEAETKQWKAFFYGQCDKAERMARVVEAARAAVADCSCGSMDLESAVRALDAAEGDA